jgi:hypothetical protein
MSPSTLHWNFGLAWIAFAVAVATHVTDEARHNFLDTYNPSALAIRRRLRLPFPPVFSFRMWLGGLIAGIVILFLLSPFAFHGAHWIRLVALFLAILIGIGNALLHIASSLRYRRQMAGVLSSPLLLAAAIWLLWSVCGETSALF